MWQMEHKISRNIKNMLKKFQRIFETSVFIHEIYKKIY